MGPLALISEELRAGRLLAPISEPALRTRGYFVYALEASSDASAVAALRKWLVAAGSLAETEFATYLSAIAPNRRSIPARNAPPLKGLEFTYIRLSPGRLRIAGTPREVGEMENPNERQN